MTKTYSDNPANEHSQLLRGTSFILSPDTRSILLNFFFLLPNCRDRIYYNGVVLVLQQLLSRSMEPQSLSMVLQMQVIGCAPLQIPIAGLFFASRFTTESTVGHLPLLSDATITDPLMMCSERFSCPRSIWLQYHWFTTLGVQSRL